MSALTNWLARNIYTSEEDEQMFADLQRQNAATIQRQVIEGKRTIQEGYALNTLNDSIGTATYDKELGGSRGSILWIVPWYIWAGIVAVIFWYLGGFFWLKGILEKR